MDIHKLDYNQLKLCYRKTLTGGKCELKKQCVEYNENILKWELKGYE